MVYDSLHQRWVAIEASFDCFTDADDERRHRLHRHRDLGRPRPDAGLGRLSIGFTDALPDYPGIGTSTDKVVVSANVFELGRRQAMGCGPIESFLGTEMDVWPGTS